jgi:hypothetical protein
MKQTKFILIAAGVLGLLSIFVLPYISIMGHSVKLWDLHSAEASPTEGLLNGPKQVYVMLVAFLGAGAMGVLGMKKLLRWQGIVGILCGLIAFACETVRKGFSGDHGVSTAIGGKMVFIAALLAIVGGVVAIAKPEQG